MIKLGIHVQASYKPQTVNEQLVEKTYKLHVNLLTTYIWGKLCRLFLISKIKLKIRFKKITLLQKTILIATFVQSFIFNYIYIFIKLLIDKNS